MKKPYCKICNGKNKSDEYIWDKYNQELVHKGCREIKRDALVRVGVARLNAKERK